MKNELYTVTVTINVLAKDAADAKDKIQRTLARNGHQGRSMTAREFKSEQTGLVERGGPPNVSRTVS